MPGIFGGLAESNLRLCFSLILFSLLVGLVSCHGDQYIPEALDELDHYSRDHRMGDVRHLTPGLFDPLHDLTASRGDSRGEIDAICGYRTPSSNEFLRTRNPHTCVAQPSLRRMWAT